MLVSLNGKWKLPISYFFLNKITSVIQAELVKTELTLTDNAGLTVCGITCDGAYSNLATMKILGCEFEKKKYDEIKCWFNHPVNPVKECSAVFVNGATAQNTVENQYKRP